ncbi:MAG: hypothetical protein V1747_06480 [Candidatus Omnitrophota bacterium]
MIFGKERIIYPYARNLLFLLALLASLYIIGVIVVNDYQIIVPVTWLIFMGLFSIYKYTNKNRRYYTPIILTIFYFFGYLLSLANTLMNKSNLRAIGFKAIGSFGFSFWEYLSLTFIISTGMLGILCSVVFMEKFKNSCRSLFRYFNPNKKQIIRINYVIISLLIWFLISTAIFLYMNKIGIGRTGLKPETLLPFKLVGILFYVKLILIPCLGCFLFGVILETNNKILINLSIILLILLGIIGSISGISRGSLIFSVLPSFIYMLFKSHKNDFKRKILKSYSIIAILLLMILIPLVLGMRNIGYAGGKIDFSTAINILKSFKVADLPGAAGSLISLILDRVMGINELYAVFSSGIKDLYAPWALFITDGAYLEKIIKAVFGFVPSNEGNLAFGVGFGLWGVLQLSGSYSVIFLGTFVACSLSMAIEEIFIRNGMYYVACFFAINFGMLVWEGLYVSRLSRTLLMIFICLIITVSLKKLFYRRITCETSL